MVDNEIIFDKMNNKLGIIEANCGMFQNLNEPPVPTT